MTKEQIKQYRINLGVSIDDMAALLGVARHTYIKWENGQRKPNKAVLRLYDIFDILGKKFPSAMQHITTQSFNQ